MALLTDRPQTGVNVALDEEQFSVASQRQLIWWRFKKHRVALFATVIVGLFYLTVIGADFIAYSHPSDNEAFRGLIPPQPVRLFDGWKPSLHVCAVSGARDPETFVKVYERDCSEKYHLRLFARGLRVQVSRHHTYRSTPDRYERFEPSEPGAYIRFRHG